VLIVASKSVLIALVTAVLAIGGCLPCQTLLAGEPSKKSCCNSKGECQRPGPETPAKKSCNLKLADMQSEPQQQSDRLVDGAQAGAGEPIAESALLSSSVVEAAGVRDIDSSPPPLFLLNLALLI
jgi:hypothetical protein